MDIDKQIVLALNRNWQPIGWRTVRQSLIAMSPELGRDPQVMALDLEIGPDGDLTYAVPVGMDDWMQLPVRATDMAIGTKSRPIRCPTVTIAKDFGDMPLKEPQLTSEAIFRRDGCVDQYDGKSYPRSELNIDHVIPRNRGGKNSWDNMVVCEKRKNFSKSNKLNEEVGLRLIRKPVRPKAVPACFTIGKAKLKDHVPFIS